MISTATEIPVETKASLTVETFFAGLRDLEDKPSARRSKSDVLTDFLRTQEVQAEVGKLLGKYSRSAIAEVLASKGGSSIPTARKALEKAFPRAPISEGRDADKAGHQANRDPANAPAKAARKSSRKAAAQNPPQEAVTTSVNASQTGAVGALQSDASSAIARVNSARTLLRKVGS